ncbi:hypothetical protein FQA39_LY14215 [Lamprigera yunnana]|nr:hypothetical protein FQA39_LY14215 [Lamprigera yunnana]
MFIVVASGADPDFGSKILRMMKEVEDRDTGQEMSQDFDIHDSDDSVVDPDYESEDFDDNIIILDQNMIFWFKG